MSKDDKEIDLEQACLVMKKIMEHVNYGGSFRHLIYERLGFGPEAYCAMLKAGGLEFSNLCPFPAQSEEPRICALAVLPIETVEHEENTPNIFLVTLKGKDSLKVRWGSSSHKPVIGEYAVYYYKVGPGYGTPVALSVKDNVEWSAYEHSD